MASAFKERGALEHGKKNRSVIYLVRALEETRTRRRAGEDM